jgi:hypothetical protein
MDLYCYFHLSRVLFEPGFVLVGQFSRHLPIMSKISLPYKIHCQCGRFEFRKEVASFRTLIHLLSLSGKRSPLRLTKKRRYPFSEPFFSSSQTYAPVELTTFQMTKYTCDCGFGSSHGAHDKDIIDHVRGVHGIAVNLGNAHFAHCNDCERKNGHGRRLNSMEHVINHLENHGVYINFW